ncbi:MAG TPA: putative glycoside hydrolase [Terriglobia bacterium]|nr:putative glycoside hydrolase [Terriglobia bacterium]
MRITRLHLLLGAAAVVLLAAGLCARREWTGAFGSAVTAPSTQASQPASTAASNSTAQTSAPAPGKPETTGAEPPLAPGFTLPESTKAIPYAVKRGDTVPILASRYLSEVVYMRRSELDNAIREANGLRSEALKPGATILIPGIPLEPLRDKPVTVPKNFEVRAIYLTAYTAGSAKGFDLIDAWKKAGGNAVVFDVKDFDGQLHVPFEHKYAPQPDITIRNLPKFFHYLHSLNMHAIARIALFRDAHLAGTYPQLAVHSRRTGKPWLENGKLAWTDPSNPEVQQYDLDLAKMAVNSGADEVQFDYVRFPAEGDQADAQFEYQKEHPDWPRSKVIADFLAHAYDELHPMGVLVSIDVFGVMAWARPIDLSHTGQNIAELARQCDVISPMIYPSHFFGMDGYKLPGDAPEHFIPESMKRFQVATEGSGVVLRPWLQAFGWRTKTYSPAYIVTQVRLAKDEGGVGFLFWNARNDYSKPFAAMPEMRADAGRYFRGDEVGKPVPPITATAKAQPSEPARGAEPASTTPAPSPAPASGRAGADTPHQPSN